MINIVVIPMLEPQHRLQGTEDTGKADPRS